MLSGREFHTDFFSFSHDNGPCELFAKQCKLQQYRCRVPSNRVGNLCASWLRMVENVLPAL